MTIPLLQRKAITLEYYRIFREFPLINYRIGTPGDIEIFACRSEDIENKAQIQTTRSMNSRNQYYIYTAQIVNN